MQASGCGCGSCDLGQWKAAPCSAKGAPIPEALVYEFEGITGAHYAAVSKHLGIDPETGAGAWPSGLLSHAAGVADDGTFIVSEVWSSRQDQAAWEQKLAPALASIGVTVVPRVRWVPLIAHHQA